jgi:hypothetical protein
MTCEVFPAYLTTSQHLNLKGYFQEFTKTLKNMKAMRIFIQLCGNCKDDLEMDFTPPSQKGCETQVFFWNVWEPQVAHPGTTTGMPTC